MKTEIKRSSLQSTFRYVILFSAICSILLPSLADTVIGADNRGSAAPETEPPSFVAPSPLPPENSPNPLMPPVRQDEPAVASQPLNFDVESEEHPLGRGTPGFALLGGGAFLDTKQGWSASPMLALRYYFAKTDANSEGPEALSPWSVEAGGVLPHAPIGFAEQSALTYYRITLNSSEEHLAVQYRWIVHWPVRMTPELSVGVAVTQINANSEYSINNGSVGRPNILDNKTVVGPLIRIGMPLLANDWFALRLDAGYVYAPDTVNVGAGAFNISQSGFAVYPSLQVNIGYLHPGVEKGEYLPPSAVPLWALAALQTEKRSPVIAPPEVLLNAHQAATQGGLSGNVLFQYKNRGAQKVELLGDFNHWRPEPLYMDQAHVWITVKDLPAGTYHYTFLVNGHREVRDPWNSSFDPSRRTHGTSTFVVPEVMPGRQ